MITLAECRAYLAPRLRNDYAEYHNPQAYHEWRKRKLNEIPTNDAQRQRWYDMMKRCDRIEEWQRQETQSMLCQAG